MEGTRAVAVGMNGHGYKRCSGVRTGVFMDSRLEVEKKKFSVV